jgi:chaperonin GroES
LEVPVNLKPLFDNVVVEHVEQDAKTTGGVFLPDTAKEKPQEGKIVAVGKGKYGDDGKLIPIEVKAGDKILFGKYSGSEFKHEGEDLLILREDDILGIIE